MSFTSVKRVSGLSIIVNNTVADVNGDPHVVSDDALDTGAGTHTVFGPTVALTPLTIVEFDLFDNRMFEL